MNSSVSCHISVHLDCIFVSQVVLSALLALAAARPSGIAASALAATPLAIAAPTAIAGTIQYASTPVVTGYTSQVRLCHYSVVPIILKRMIRLLHRGHKTNEQGSDPCLTILCSNIFLQSFFVYYVTRSSQLLLSACRTQLHHSRVKRTRFSQRKSSIAP
jgi:hypothetical protein